MTCMYVCEKDYCTWVLRCVGRLGVRESMNVRSLLVVGLMEGELSSQLASHASQPANQGSNDR